MKSQISPSQSSYSFHFAVTRIAVTQICRSIGFKSAQNSALSIITDVAGKYLQAVSTAAATAANAAGRTESNIVDIVAALEHLYSITGFSGGSNVNIGFYNSGPLIDIMKFVKYSDEIPFAKPLPRKRLDEKDRYMCIGNGGNGRNHIPKWLPVIPDIGGMELRKRELWPCLDENNVKMGIVERESGVIGKRELPLKRRIVKFKIGMVGKGGMGFNEGLRIGVCAGGKRVLVESWNGNQECSSVGDNKENTRRKKKIKR